MSDTLTNVERELRKRALAQFERQLDAALAQVRSVVEANAGTMFNRIPDDIDADIRILRKSIIDSLSQKVQDEAVRKGGEIMFKLLGGE